MRVIPLLPSSRRNRRRLAPWADGAPVREELFGVDRLEQHARSLAAAQTITRYPDKVLSLHVRLDENAAVLLAAYRASAAELEEGRGVVPAAEWLLDNYHLVEEQVREIRDHLPIGYYRQLPKLDSGPFVGYPRVFGIAWAFVAHTDSHVDPDILRRFIAAYQTVQPLTIGELWAVAITLRIVLIENLRRLADQITIARSERNDAEALANRLLASNGAVSALADDISVRAPGYLSEIFAAQLTKRLRDQDPTVTPALGWLDERLARQGTSIDEVVQHAHLRQAASNVTVRNVITSMRLISDIAWADLFESVSLVDARLRDGSAFADMDFPTRNLYRSAIEQLARGSDHSETEIATRALSAAKIARSRATDDIEAERLGDPGYHLVAEGRAALERAIGFVPPLRLRLGRFNVRLGMGGYVAAILLLTAGLIGVGAWQLRYARIDDAWLVALAVLAFLPLTDAATAIVNRLVAWIVGAQPLPGLELAGGVPESLRTLVAVPTLLGSDAEICGQVEQLEVHYLSGSGGDLYFALLSDWVDAASESMPDDARLLALAADEVAKLNARHAPGAGGNRFLLLHRRRVFDARENTWMGWERKRGKLQELNRVLRGASDTTFMTLANGVSQVPTEVRYVITLDADTRLPRDAACRLIGKMAHPLNRPRFDPKKQRVVDGYGILQPRVTPSLPLGRNGSFYQRIFAGPSGIDPYAATISNVYQDLFGEGSFTGKGIYDVDAFEAALAGRVPDDTLLSHDLLEGIFARSGLASDIEVIDEFPTRYDVDAKRQHRWTRGDWQLLPWIVRQLANPRGAPAIGRWKMLDNLRRSLVAPSTLLALGLCWCLPMQSASAAELLLLAAIALPIFIPSFFTLLTRPHRVSIRNHFATFVADLRLAFLQTVFSIAFLADRAWRMVDAIVRTLARVLVTRRHLLEWTTAAQSARTRTPGTIGSYREMAGGVTLALGLAMVVLFAVPTSWTLLLPLTLLWLGGPAIAMWVSRPQAVAAAEVLSSDETTQLRAIARRTWRFFETFVTPADHMLPPDNFQEDPVPVVARRTSPTNLGLYLLSAIAARDFGWAGTHATLDRIDATLASMRALPKFKGHFYNWYGTEDLRALDPPYVSSVDSGNLAGHLIVVANAVESWRHAPVAQDRDARDGMHDTLAQVRAAFAATEHTGVGATESLRAIEHLIDAAPLRFDAIAADAGRLLDTLHLVVDATSAGDAGWWLVALRDGARQHAHDRDADASIDLVARLDAIAAEARAIALGMDFAFLLDPDRKLLSIGYSLADNRLDPSCYDLLASEARLASLFAIAKGDVATKHWFRLGRSATPIGNGSALISWSGSMFEYLMPSLVMRAPAGSLLEQTNRLVVERQRGYGEAMDIPWGVSESAYNARDLDFTYQYSNFGVPGLGLKRGLSENVVIAPYATGLATMVDPRAALRNYEGLASRGGSGRYGYYDAIDFTRSRLPDGETCAVVRNFMAHHQGMTIVAICNALLDGRMRARFHAEPIIIASELLLQERMPRDVADAHPRAEEVLDSGATAAADASAVRRLAAPATGAPVTHLLSNGHYAVMLTASGAGYSRWGEIAVTRWREDPTRDADGSFIYLRDVQSGDVWSAAVQPLDDDGVERDVLFAEDHAAFMRRDGGLLTTMEVLVSGEDDGEVRRVTLTNSSRRARDIELTSYAELVLTSASADNAHPAFAKMFVQTSRLEDFDALVATRRTRSDGEAQVWAAHFAVIEGETIGPSQYETDRARFLGRGRHAGTVLAMSEGKALSDTVGTVLDPVFSLRHRVRVPPGGMTRVSFWTVIAASHDALLDLIDRHHDRSAYDRAKTFAWTQAQVQLRHLGMKSDEAADFQRLAAPIVYADPRYRVPSAAILQGMGPQSGLWPHAISGDLPIVLMRIDDVEDIAQVRQLLRAHEYWRAKRLGVDVVIINERASSYVQDLQIGIETLVRSSQSRPRLGDERARGTVYALRADLMGETSRLLLHAVARVVLIARRGPIAQQLVPQARSAMWAGTSRRSRAPTASPPSSSLHPACSDLEYFNGLGGFDRDGREYVTVLSSGAKTPAPWINVIANPQFGFQASTDGSGFTWSENSRDNQLTLWSNDPVVDPAGEVLYVRDDGSGELWTPTAQPIGDGGNYVARHGFGYSRFEHEADDVALDLLQYVPLDAPVKISRLTLHNRSARTRHLSVTGYVEWVLGTSRNPASPFIATEIDAATGAVFVRNPWGTAFPGRVTFADLGGRQSTLTCDRTEFLGRNGRLSAPAALLRKGQLSGAVGAGFDPCTALQCSVDLAPGASIEVVMLIGQCGSDVEARALIERCRTTDLDALLTTVTDHWSNLLGKVQVKTPDRAMDILLNGWLMYQTLACRIWARSAFYQASGAYGFRDQLQDGMALTFVLPAQTRQHLLRAASRQFPEGDVQHWWLPHSGQGVRTHISDDRVWLAYAVATYIGSTGDVAVLDEPVTWLEGPPLRAEDHDAFFKPDVSAEHASLFEHCARGLDQCIALHGEHGLPLMGTGDWNDGMNRVGQAGRGESVWLAWLLVRTLELFAPFAERGASAHGIPRDAPRAVRWRAHEAALRQSIEREAWDGAWYRRATFDDGTWLGSSDNDECRIDSIAQSWAVLSGASDESRATLAMASVDGKLIDRDQRIALLFKPPFDRTPHDPGYIKGYPPGLRENGGQYSHAAMWAILAFAKLGAADKAVELFALLNPVLHARTRAEVQRYKVEPYVVAADVYSIAPHGGRGGWTWYTGSAAWMYRAGIEGILGIRREGDVLVVEPAIPARWPGYTATVTLDATRYAIEVRTRRVALGESKGTQLDGAPIDGEGGAVRLPLDGREHTVLLLI